MKPHYLLLLLFLIIIINSNTCYSDFHSIYKTLKVVCRIIDWLTQFAAPSYERPLIDENEVFDFIIVGAGSAGSVLANRLSQVASWKILLIEAGDTPSILTKIPALSVVAHFSKNNWKYHMERQDDFGLGLEDQVVEARRGKGLGGSSLINSMVAVRGNKIDYDQWGENNPGWTYKDIFPYFLKLEDSQLDDADGHYHSYGGNLHIEHPEYRTKIAKVTIDAAKSIGINYTDYNGHTQLGISFVQGTTKNGFRDSHETAYLRPVKDRENLKILTKSRVTNILIDPSTKSTLGVEYYYKKKYYTVTVSKEVILSAGTFHSPQILMLSGIGPMENLKKFEIPLVKDLPVGKKMYDHLAFMGVVYTVKKHITMKLFDFLKPFDIIRYLLTGYGPWSMLGAVVEGIAYLRSNLTESQPSYPDIQLLCVNSNFATDYGLIYKQSFRISDHSYNKFFRQLQGRAAFQIIPILLHPKSVGNVTLRSRNPLHSPKIFGNYLTDPDNEDAKTLIAAIRQVQKITQADIWKRYGLEQHTTPIPGCEHYEFDSDEYWECGVRHITVSFHHQMGTCKMGPEWDPASVVDNQLRVIGVKGLRVCDLSVVPIPLTAHTNIPATIIGEKGSDIIKQDWLSNN